MIARPLWGNWAMAALAAAVSVTALGACGSSGSTAAKADATTTAPTANGNATFCKSWVSVEAAASKGPGGEEGPTPDEMVTFAKSLQPLLAEATHAAPHKLDGALSKVNTIVNDATFKKNLQAFDPSGPALSTPLDTINAWAHDSCGFAKLDVMGIDYAFEDVPATVEAGVVSIKFTNMAKDEQHEMGLMRLKDTATVTSDTLVAALKSDAGTAEQKYGDQVDFLADVQAGPGESSYNVSTLKPGSYLAVCFVPVGGKDSGVPHVQKGMVTPFTVK